MREFIKYDEAVGMQIIQKITTMKKYSLPSYHFSLPQTQKWISFFVKQGNQIGNIERFCNTTNTEISCC